MKLLSEQVREIVKQSSMSSYAIAKEAGIDKSAMSRFVNGGTLTMKKLDQLAKVLGLVVSPKVARVERPLEKGRPKKKKEIQMDTIDRQDHKAMAMMLAEEAFTFHFESKQGFFTFGDSIFAYYNNHPYASHPGLRRQETKRIKTRLEKAGFQLLASGHGGDKLHESTGDQRYTITLIVRCSSESEMTSAKQMIEQEIEATRNNLLHSNKE